MNVLQTLADSLWRARLEGRLVPKPGEQVVSSWAEGGYEVQRAIVQRSGEAQRGWKVGSTSAEAQARLGTDQPGAGALLDRFCYPNEATVAIHPAHDVWVEAEFVLVVSQALPPRPEPYTRDDVRRCVGQCLPGLEFVGSRFEGGLTDIGRALITADGGGNVAFVEGEPPLSKSPMNESQSAASMVPPIDLGAVEVCLSIDDQACERGTGARALGHPLNVLVWLANHLSQRGITLNAGERVSTGTCTGLVAVTPGNLVTADFGPIGRVSATLVAASAKAQ